MDPRSESELRTYGAVPLGGMMEQIPSEMKQLTDFGDWVAVSCEDEGGVKDA